MGKWGAFPGSWTSSCDVQSPQTEVFCLGYFLAPQPAHFGGQSPNTELMLMTGFNHERCTDILQYRNSRQSYDSVNLCLSEMCKLLN